MRAYPSKKPWRNTWPARDLSCSNREGYQNWYMGKTVLSSQKAELPPKCLAMAKNIKQKIKSKSKQKQKLIQHPHSLTISSKLKRSSLRGSSQDSGDSAKYKAHKAHSPAYKAAYKDLPGKVCLLELPVSWAGSWERDCISCHPCWDFWWHSYLLVTHGPLKKLNKFISSLQLVLLVCH